MKKKYSVIIEYKSGTFVSQINTVNETQALILAFSAYNSNKDYGELFNETLLKEVKFLLSNNLGPIKVNKVCNIWYFHFSIGKDSGHCHIVDTAV